MKQDMNKWFDSLIDQFAIDYKFPKELENWDDEELGYFLNRVRTRLRESEARLHALKCLCQQATRNDI